MGKNNSSNKGVFLFFVVGLFMLQIIFAFTIHGDIGPQTPAIPEAQQTTNPVLIGRIDAVLGRQTAVQKPVHPAPEAVMAPAIRPSIEPARMTVQASTPAQTPARKQPALKDAGTRYLEYTVVKGDTLDGISKKLYGNTRMVTALVRVNRLQDEKGLKIGNNLLVPRLGLQK
jgi:nucleoid-associated protein YgaU